MNAFSIVLCGVSLAAVSWAAAIFVTVRRTGLPVDSAWLLIFARVVNAISNVLVTFVAGLLVSLTVPSLAAVPIAQTWILAAAAELLIFENDIPFLFGLFNDPGLLIFIVVMAVGIPQIICFWYMGVTVLNKEYGPPFSVWKISVETFRNL